MKRLIEQLLKFGVVGVLAFFIDYGLMVLLTEAFSVDYLISATVSFVVSVVFNYLASMRYVFRHREGLTRRREFALFVVLSVVGLLLNDVLMWLGTDLASIDYRITKIAVTFLVAVYNFVTRKVFLDAGAQGPAEQEIAAREEGPLP
ncbi:GtrA family protein [Parvibacter caecicola]|uniref:GtrA family protein n=1 Tax=Parvibacter caecicola TaxID=747645 RepID=A0A4T9T9W7_9ACTN|nr:GtrA family protein [Parvibacter caecicola]TJW12389.1 GtrA family protein [Parvibacter caecicola]